MHKHQDVNPVEVMESDEDKFQRLLKEAGIVTKVEKEIFSPEARVEKIKECLDLLKIAKESKNEAQAKKIRRYLRKTLKFSIRAHQQVVVS